MPSVVKYRRTVHLPGHPLSLHDLERTLSPSQPDPPNAGAGLVQDRRDICVPPPHDTEHGSQALHSDHLPSTMHSTVVHISVRYVT